MGLFSGMGITEWHLSALPMVTIQGQMLKVLEEAREYIEDGSIEELADLAIATTALDERFGFPVFNDFMLDCVCRSGHGMGDIRQAIRDKLEINRGRVWELVDGVYRHTSIQPQIADTQPQVATKPTQTEGENNDR